MSQNYIAVTVKHVQARMPYGTMIIQQEKILLGCSTSSFWFLELGRLLLFFFFIIFMYSHIISGGAYLQFQTMGCFTFHTKHYTLQNPEIHTGIFKHNYYKTH